MSFFEIGSNDSLYYEYEPPSGNQTLTFVFVNAITGDTGMWQTEIGPALRDAGSVSYTHLTLPTISDV